MRRCGGATVLPLPRAWPRGAGRPLGQCAAEPSATARQYQGLPCVTQPVLRLGGAGGDRWGVPMKAVERPLVREEVKQPVGGESG